MSRMLAVMAVTALGTLATAPAHAAPALDGPPPTITVKQAKTLAKKAISKHYTVLDERQTCKRRSRLSFTCITRWAIGDLGWSVSVQLRRTGSYGSPTDRYTMRAVARNYYRRRARTRTHRGVLPTPTRRAPIGASLTLHPDDRDGHLTIRVRAGHDPATPVEYEPPAAGHRYVTFWLDITNRTSSGFEVPLFGSEAALVLADGTTVQGKSIEPVEGCDQRLSVPEGETRTVCVAFELRHGVQVRALELNWGSGWPETGQWRL